MHIKRVVIRGFKTYKNETIIEDFSPHHNVVVGRNGSGKSNCFAAIRFVLSDAYMNMTREERLSLIHESSVNIMSAFVEIVFDNTDRRIPIAKDEISIRRTIGMKKDDYSLDFKSSTKSDIMNLLEASGFSKSNPYYIVPQGKVTALTNAKDSERLELLKDIAGARVFEVKLKDSLKEMTITNEKQVQINEMLTDIETRLNELNIEREDLKEFDKLTNKKKMLEFNIFHREMKALTDQIEQIESKYSTSALETETLNSELEERENTIMKLESVITKLDSKKVELEIDSIENGKELQEILQQISNLTIQLQDLNADSNALSSSGSFSKRMDTLNAEIQNEKQNITALKQTILDLKQKESAIKLKLNDLRQKQMAIISKKNQKSKFSSKEERDNYIKAEISKLSDSKAKKLEAIRLYESTLKQHEQEKLSLDSERAKLAVFDDVNKTIDSYNEGIYSLKTEARNLVDERSLLWRKESKLKNLITAKEDQLSTIEQSLRGNIDRTTLNALDIVKSIAHRLGPNVENGVYGYLGELIDVSEKYKTAVDVIGGSSLFHIVVNNDQTASILINEMKKEKNCRTTFIPLNRLKNDNFQIPITNDSVPLIKKIAYDDFLAPAVKQIFGRTVVCISLQKGYELASAYGVTGITLDGDRCDNSGVLTGGFRDLKISRIDFLKSLRNCKAEIYKINEELKDLQNQLNTKNFEINSNFDKTQELKQTLNAQLNEKAKLNSQLVKIENLLEKNQQEIGLVELKINTNHLSVENIDQTIKNYENELQAPFLHDGVSAADEEQLRKIHDELPLLEKEQKDLLSEIDNEELKLSSITTLLTENMLPRYSQLRLESELASENAKDSESLAEDLQRRLTQMEERKDELKTIEANLNKELSLLKEEISDNKTEIEKLNAEQEEFIKQFENYGKSTDKNLIKKLRLKQRKHDLEKSIGELGILPEETLSIFENDSTESLSKKLTRINERLKSYSHVNKKAMEQFSKFSKQRDSLFERLGELNEAKSSIEHLINVLQERKNEAIIRTFKEVSIGFSKIFEELVPAGKGRLIIQKKNEQPKGTAFSLSQYPDTAADPENLTEQQDDAENNKSVDSFIGISLSVSFNSKKNEQLRLEQLSGGQKSLCALALILAIQSCDPAPFYLFDEIDSNLDSQYRTAVANLIHRLSKNAQFICTTFRPEMLKVSDKFYGVMFHNKVSTISNIDADRALDFVEDQHHL